MCHALATHLGKHFVEAAVMTSSSAVHRANLSALLSTCQQSRRLLWRRVHPPIHSGNRIGGSLIWGKHPFAQMGRMHSHNHTFKHCLASNYLACKRELCGRESPNTMHPPWPVSKHGVGHALRWAPYLGRW